MKYAIPLFIAARRLCLFRPAGRCLCVLSAMALLGLLSLAPGRIAAQTISIAGDVDPSPADTPVWTVGGALTIGFDDDGTLSIEAGGKVSNTYGYIGFAPDSTGEVTVMGSGSLWENSDHLEVGSNASGTLNIEGGGKVSNTYGYIGTYSDSIGEVTVTGSGSLWESDGSLNVGFNGSGTLNIEAGGKVSNTSGYIGYGLDSIGEVTVTGSGSFWENSGSLEVGSNGSGTLNIEGGGKVSNTYGYIGTYSDSTGEVTVTGSGSLWENDSFLAVGTYGNGTLNIEDGGKVSNTSGYIGYGLDSTGEVTVTGSGSLWENSGSLEVGSNGSGTLNIEDGGKVSSLSAIIGTYSGSSGTVTVTGADSLWDSSLLFLGVSGSGTLNIEDGGKVRVGWLDMAGGSNAKGTLNLTGTDANRGVIETEYISEGFGALGGKINFDGGILRATGDENDFLRNFESGDVEFLSGGAFIDTQQYDIGISTDLTGVGGLTKLGRGTLVLSGINTHAGPTVLQQGTVQVTDQTQLGQNVNLQFTADLASVTGVPAAITGLSDAIQTNTGVPAAVAAYAVAIDTAAADGSLPVLKITGETVFDGDGPADDSLDADSRLVLDPGKAGAIHVQNGGSLIFQDYDSTTGGAITGGAISLDVGSLLDLRGGVNDGEYTLVFIGNEAWLGGAIFNSNSSTVSLTNVSFSGNSADSGGAIYNINDGTVSLTNVSFSGNSAGYGGAISNLGSILSITNASFSSNEALNYGGAIYNTSGTVSLTNVSFSGNEAFLGGAIYNNNGGTVSLTNVSFSGNKASLGGGAIYNNFDAALDLTTTSGHTSLFTGNTADGVSNAIRLGSVTILAVHTESGGLLDMRDPMNSVSGSGRSLTKTGSGVWALGGGSFFVNNDNTFSINEGSLYLYAEGEVDNSVRDTDGNVLTAADVAAGSIQLDGADSSFTLGSNATLVAGGINSITTAGTILFEDGSTLRGGSSSQSLGGTNPFSEAGGATSLLLEASGGVLLNGTINLAALAATDVFTLSAILTGNGGINKVGSGTVVLDQASTYNGITAINEGTLRVANPTGSATGTGSVFVGPGSTLAGDGFITGAVNVNDGGTLAPGLSPGTLSLGELLINPAAHLAFELGTPDAIGGPTNDLVDVVQNLQGSGSSGNLVMNGGLFDILSLGGVGVYTLVSWDGDLMQSGTPSIGLWQAGYFFEGGLVVDEALKQVRLTVTTDGLQFWDGNGASADGILSGGDGIWDLTDARWTNSDGSAANMTWQDGYGAVFGGLGGGLVMLHDNVNVGVEGLHFAADGYTLSGVGEIAISAANTMLVIDAGLGATIENVITGGGGFEKNGLGEITFAADNTYGGDTVVRYGTLHARSLANSTVKVEGGAFSPGGVGAATAIQVAGLALDGGSLLFDIGSGGTDHIEVLDGLALLNEATLFQFTDTGVQAVDYVLISGLADGWDQGLLGWAGVGSGSFKLSADGTELLFRPYFGELIGGAILQNSLPVGTPVDANFLVSGSVRTGELWESNRVNSLHFTPGGSLQVYNTLAVSSGSFTTQGGKAVIQGGTVLVPDRFDKFGPGILEARSNFVVAGNSYVHSGALAVNGAFQTDLLHVLNGGTLMGNGLIIGNVLNAGAVAPGNSIGLLTILGNYTQTRGGTLQIEAASVGHHDVLAVSGHARLDGTLELVSLGYKPKYGDQLPFLRAGSISGKFDTIEIPDPEVNRGRFLNLGSVGVLLVAPASYTLVAQTPNQTRVAEALDQWIGIEEGDIGIVTLALDLLREEQYPQAFEAVIPGYYEAALSTGVELSHSHSQLLHQQLNARRLAYRIANVPAMPPAPNAKNADEVRKAITPVQPQSESDLRWSAWTQGSGLFSSGGLSLTPGEDFESGTILVGADYLLTDNLVIGLFASYQEGWGDYDHGGDIDLDATRFGAYLTYDQGGFYANTAIGAGQTSFDIKRPIRWAYLDRSATSNPDAFEFFTSLSTGYDLKRGNWIFGPQVSLQYNKLSLDETTESGAGALNLQLQEADTDSLRSYVGGRIAYTHQVSQRFAIIPEVRAFWQHEFLDRDSVTARLDGGNGPAFIHTFSDPDKDSFYLGAGIGFQIGERFYANIYYNLDLGRREEESHTISVSGTVRF